MFFFTQRTDCRRSSIGSFPKLLECSFKRIFYAAYFLLKLFLHIRPIAFITYPLSASKFRPKFVADVRYNFFNYHRLLRLPSEFFSKEVISSANAKLFFPSLSGSPSKTSNRVAFFQQRRAACSYNPLYIFHQNFLFDDEGQIPRNRRKLRRRDVTFKPFFLLSQFFNA